MKAYPKYKWLREIGGKNLNNIDYLNLSRYDRYYETLIESSGVDIALSIYEAKPNDPCIVFLPGTMTHPLFYDEFLSSLAEKGFNVIGVHFVSHGKSPRTRTKYYFEGMVQNAKDAVSYCIERFNDNVMVMGSSQGGILSILLATVDRRVKAAFPHNILLTSLKESICVTRFPGFLRHIYGLVRLSLRIGGKLFPTLQLPITFYLDDNKIFTDDYLKHRFYSDAIGLTRYPMCFLSSLFYADLTGITDGSIQCPIVVIASTGDPLFPYDYTVQVFDKIVAPHKEMLVFEEHSHLIFNECVDVVLDPLVAKLREYA